MNALIANLLLERIAEADLPWIDKTAGLTRAIPIAKKGLPVRMLPVACTVDDPLACDDNALAELLPEEKYASILFIEGDTFPERIADRVMGVRFISRLRIVVWMNCNKLGGSCDCGSLAALNLITALSVRKYTSGDLKEVRHKVVGGGPTRGKEIFSKYTFDEERSQYLHYPFDFFALDVETEIRVMPGCEEKLMLSNAECPTPPTNGRRRYPREFTLEELTDPTNGLSAETIAALCA